MNIINRWTGKRPVVVRPERGACLFGSFHLVILPLNPSVGQSSFFRTDRLLTVVSHRLRPFVDGADRRYVRLRTVIADRLTVTDRLLTVLARRNGRLVTGVPNR